MQAYAPHLITHEDFPKPGVLFYDFSALARDPILFRKMITDLAEKLIPFEFDVVAGIDARGFIFGGALAFHCNKGFVMLRKPNKLPGELLEMSYELEYGHNVLSLQKGTIHAGERVLIMDDVLATGGTAEVASRLIEAAGAQVSALAFILEITDLKARASLAYPIESLITV